MKDGEILGLRTGAIGVLAILKMKQTFQPLDSCAWWYSI
jgi:hypothetical protein